MFWIFTICGNFVKITILSRKVTKVCKNPKDIQVYVL